jgi:hypothetical protein
MNDPGTSTMTTTTTTTLSLNVTVPKTRGLPSTTLPQSEVWYGLNPDFPSYLLSLETVFVADIGNNNNNNNNIL